MLLVSVVAVGRLVFRRMDWSLKFFFEKTRSRYLFSLNELCVVLHTSYARLLKVVIVVASCDVRL